MKSKISTNPTIKVCSKCGSHQISKNKGERTKWDGRGTKPRLYKCHFCGITFDNLKN